MTHRKLRVIFFGTADFAVPSLIALLEAGHEVAAAVTQPDRPHGRGRHVSASPVKQAAAHRGLPVLQPKRVRSEAFLTRLQEIKADVLALAAFGQIVPQALLDMPPLGPVNVHGSLLPQYRGAAPIQRALMAGEAETGVTTMWMDATLDTGDILLARRIGIEPEDTAGTLTPRMAALGASLLLETLEGLSSGAISRQAQDDSQATFAPALQSTDGEIRWDEPAIVLVNRIRGVTPKPGATAVVKDRRVKIWRAAPCEATAHAMPGTVLGYNKQPPGLIVATGAGTAVLLMQAQPENGRQMLASDWARGLRLNVGDVFLPTDAQRVSPFS